jgi:hypothetical protein
LSRVVELSDDYERVLGGHRPVQGLLGVDELDGLLVEAVKCAPLARVHHALSPQVFALPGRERALTNVAAEVVLQSRQYVVERDPRVVHHVGREQLISTAWAPRR